MSWLARRVRPWNDAGFPFQEMFGIGPVISKGADWLVVSFHTVPPDELIEERPGGKQMLYESERKRAAPR